MNLLNLRLVPVAISIWLLFSVSPILAYSYGYKDAGVCKWSDVNCTNIEYWIDRHGSDNYTDNDDEMPPIHKAFETWENVATSKADFTYKGFVDYIPYWGDDLSTIGWVETQEMWTGLGCDIHDIGYTRALYEDANSPFFKEVDIFINGANWQWSAEDVCPPSCVDIQNTATHEVGHVLGLLDVSSLPERTMYEEAFCGETKKRTLESDDIAGASFLYPYDATWPQTLTPVHTDLEHTYFVDVALAWNPEEAEEDFHLACQEGYQFEGLGDTVIPFDAPVSPVRVVYGKQTTTGWVKSDILSGYHQRISGPQLEISNVEGEDYLHIIWTENDANYTISRVVYRTKKVGPNEQWSAPEEVSYGPVYWARDPTIAVARNAKLTDYHYGKVYAAWVQREDNNDVVYFCYRHDGYWSAIQKISSAPSCTSPKLALDSTGGVHIVWIEGQNICWKKNSYGGSGSWTNTVSQYRAPDAGGVSVAIDGYGYVHICYAVNHGTNNTRIHYDRLSLDGTTWQTMLDRVSPDNARAINHAVTCDNLGFVHFLWSDNRNYPGTGNWDVFYRRNTHMGDAANWESDQMIYSLRPTYYVQLGDVAQPDTFGDLFVGIDAYRTPDNNWDVYATRARQDDGVRSFPWPQGLQAFCETVAEPTVEPQGCYLKPQINKVLYLAPEDAELCCYSVDGRRVLRAKIKGVGEMELSTLPRGIYLVQLRINENDTRSAKVLVIH